jgi:uracil-DNA glycosylase
MPAPPSLKNIFKEIHQDLSLPVPSTGCLIPWAVQGVLLLNAVLSVEESRPNSHQGWGWEIFTDRIMEILNLHPQPLVFMLWGKYAQEKAHLITDPKHLMLKAPHPSPLSAHRGFLGCGHFSAANQFLTTSGRDPIDWHL